MHRTSWLSPPSDGTLCLLSSRAQTETIPEDRRSFLVNPYRVLHLILGPGQCMYTARTEEVGGFPAESLKHAPVHLHKPRETCR